MVEISIYYLDEGKLVNLSYWSEKLSLKGDGIVIFFFFTHTLPPPWLTESLQTDLQSSKINGEKYNFLGRIPNIINKAYKP